MRPLSLMFPLMRHPFTVSDAGVDVDVAVVLVDGDSSAWRADLRRPCIAAMQSAAVSRL
jgi:hypothetical protein